MAMAVKAQIGFVAFSGQPALVAHFAHLAHLCQVAVAFSVNTRLKVKK
jgi:hypothetical protein